MFRTAKRGLLASFLVLILSMFGWISCEESPSGEPSITADPVTSDLQMGKNPNTIPFSDAASYFEFNATDNDLGLQIFLDAEGWDKVRVDDANGKQIVQILTQGALAQLGITEIRFESEEPSPEEVLTQFPPGEYQFSGKTVEGENLYSTTELSHDFVTAPVVSPSDGEEVDPENTVISWDAPGAELVEIIIESEETDNVFDVIVESETTSLTIPAEFLEPGTEYKLEILAYAENGNRTITETTFITGDEENGDGEED